MRKEEDEMSDWSASEKVELAQHYARIGYVAGELWPAPPPELSASELLEVMRLIPDRGGRAGWMAALARRADG
jgi:hypothetical protein